MDPKDRKPGTEDKVTADISTYCLTRLPHIKYIKVKPLKLWGCRVWEKEVALLQNHIFFLACIAIIMEPKGKTCL